MNIPVLGIFMLSNRKRCTCTNIFLHTCIWRMDPSLLSQLTCVTSLRLDVEQKNFPHGSVFLACSMHAHGLSLN